VHDKDRITYCICCPGWLFTQDAVGRQAFTPGLREFSARRRAVIAANPELQEREALKGLALAVSMAGALMQRGVPDPDRACGRGTGRAHLEDRL